jgi:succinate dehydrogenase/fumarate reductase cytochrome b subunit
VFVWLFHRISGVLLIFLLALQFATGFMQAGSAQGNSLKVAAGMHQHPTFNCLLVFLVTFHGLYGVRTILLDLGLKRERLLFWLCTGVGIVVFAAFLAYYSSQIAR